MRLVSSAGMCANWGIDGRLCLLATKLSGSDGASSSQQQPAAANGTCGDQGEAADKEIKASDSSAEERSHQAEETPPQAEAEPAAAAEAAPPLANSSGVVSLNVTASPARHATLISPFGSPSTWIVSGDGQTSDVHINGDHVTQVRVDASSVLRSADQRPETPPPAAPLLPPPPLLDMDQVEDRDQNEEWTRFAIPAPVLSPATSPVNVSVNNNVTAVQVEHTTPPATG